MGRRRYDLPIAEFADVAARPGLFGGPLGYRAVDLSLREGGLIVLAYVPRDAPVADHIRSRLPQVDSDQDGPHTEAPTDGQTGDADEREQTPGE